jgi:hypothetical protein
VSVESPLLLVVERRARAGSGAATWEEPGADLPWWRLLDVDGTRPTSPRATESDWIGRQIFPGRLAAPAGATAVLAMFQEPVREHEAEFNAWMDTEHVPALGAVPGVLAARRYESVVGRPRYLGLYHLADSSVCTSEAWRLASDTPWRARIRPHTRHRERHVLVAAGSNAALEP